MWDDTALIEAYDRAVSLAKDKVARRMESKAIAGPSSSSEEPESSTSKSSSKKGSWKVGDYVQSIYSEDGVNYEAIIKSINQSNNSCCVKYLGMKMLRVSSISKDQL
jgi:survival motor neuron protein